MSELHQAARGEGYDLAVYTATQDLSFYSAQHQAPRSLFRSIQYEHLAALIIIHHSFHDDRLAEEMIRDALSHGVRVFCIGQVHPGCYCFINDYQDVYKSLLRHVIVNHGARDTFYIAGLPDEPNSRLRVQCYREVLEELDLPFMEENLVWGNYDPETATDIVERLLHTRRSLPRAIFCANDAMALAVCDLLRENSLRVPEDVIVTGFDATPPAFMLTPRLTTVGDDPHALACQILRILSAGEDAPAPDQPMPHPFHAVLSSSCGCSCETPQRYDAITVFRRLQEMKDHESALYHNMERLVTEIDRDRFFLALSRLLLPGSMVCLNKSFLDIYEGKNYSPNTLEDTLYVIPWQPVGTPPEPWEIPLSDLNALENPSGEVTVFCPIHSDTISYGLFVARTHDLDKDTSLIKRIGSVLNMIFTIQLGNVRQHFLVQHLEDSLYLDPVSKLMNLKGLTRWFTSFIADRTNHLQCVALSVYEIAHYSSLYEQYGIEETESLISLISDILVRSNPGVRNIARISDHQFALIHTMPDDQLSEIINASTNSFFRETESWNEKANKPYTLEINCGCTHMDSGWADTTLENLIHLALGELYLNRMNASIPARRKDDSSVASLYSTFSLLMEKNLFKFHFQPIIDARNGRICGYEALMRTDSLINLSPIEILEVAEHYDRLYEVERATIFGILEQYLRDYDKFRGCKVFINTIPGHFLNEADCEIFLRKFEKYLDCVIFELTEQDATSDEELARLKQIHKPGSETQIAIDDYGTGHSNMVNLLRYAPQIIKIDRGLISGIQNDSNKQLFVRNTIDFAHQNGILALAEGVETLDELKAVIDYGIDLIQGFYTARPAEQPLQALSKKVYSEIMEENLWLVKYDNDTLIYIAEPETTVDLLNLSLNKFTFLQLGAGTTTLVGEKSHCLDMVIRIPDDTRATVVLKHINIRGATQTTIQLGQRCDVTLVIDGQNTLSKEGILVPASSRLTIQGDGHLVINNSRNYAVGIGANYNDPYGTILLDLEGNLTMRASGDRVVCIGGGRSAGEGIRFLRGHYDLSANGINVLCIGSTSGDADVTVQQGTITAHGEGNDVMLLGAMTGEARLRLNGNISVVADGERATGIGTMSGSADVLIEGGNISSVIHCDAGVCVGSFNGEATVLARDASVDVHGEGNNVVGFGSLDGACDTRLESGFFRAELQAGAHQLLGNEHSRCVITGGNFTLFRPDENPPVSPAGQPLVFFQPKEDHFEHTFRDRRGAWTYVADRDQRGRLGVWIPSAAFDD